MVKVPLKVASVPPEWRDSEENDATQLATSDATGLWKKEHPRKGRESLPRESRASCDVEEKKTPRQRTGVSRRKDQITPVADARTVNNVDHLLLNFPGNYKVFAIIVL